MCPFKKGDVLEVSEDITAKKDQFSKSEIMIFKNAWKSLTPGITDYTFRSESGEYKIFSMPDSEGIEKLNALFKKTEKKPKSQNSFSLLTVLIIVALIGVVFKITFHFSYVIDTIKKEPLYAVGAFIFGVMVFLVKITNDKR